MTQPPRIATWLLKRTLSSPTRESLIGDLVERHRGGRSSPWYWRQALLAICGDFVSEVSDHKLLVIRAISICIAVVFLLGLVTSPLSIWFGKSVWNWTVENNLDSLRGILFRQSGWIMASITAAFVWPMAGWIIARTHRPRGMAMVFACLVFHHVVYLGQYARWYSSMAPGPPVTALLVVIASWLLTTTVYFIVGGLVGAGSNEDASQGILE